MKNVLFLDEVHSILEERLVNHNFNCLDYSNKSIDEIDSILSTIHGIVIRSRFPMNESLLARATKLEFIARSGAGMENIDIDYCNSRNIALFNAPEGNRNAVAEHALGMLLALFNNINKGDNEVRNGVWDREGNRGVELDGKTVGIIGFGNNGSSFAKKLRGFDVEVLAYDKYKSGFNSDFVSEVEMDEIFKKVDVVSFHIPQNKETTYLVNDDYLSNFLNPIYVINLARGKIIESQALMKAIHAKRVLGACLDVLEYEKSSFENIFSDKNNLPFAFKQILESENIILSPHVGGWTKESYFGLSNVLANKVLTFYKLA
jgi:D-3-phosphoglycerate dehydrogenase